MTTPGYPDYTRFSRSGNQQLCGFFSTSFTSGQQLFKGYVGSWPYTAVFMDIGASADFARFEMIYFSDSTFTLQVGFRFSIRTGGNFSSICYGNMSDWLIIQVHTKSGNPIAIQVFGAYATEGYSPVSAQDSIDVPLITASQVVGAGSTVVFNIVHVHPGVARMLAVGSGATWAVGLFYYDYTAGAFTQLHFTTNFAAAGIYESDWSTLDAPMQVKLFNGSAGAFNMSCSLVPK